MKKNTAFQPNTSESRNTLEFLTVFGISILFTFAGLQVLEMETEMIQTDVEIHYAETEHVQLPTLGLDKFAELFKYEF